MKKTSLTSALLILGLSGCAGAPDTSDEIITIRTAPVIASTTCTVSNTNGAWSVWDIPGTVSILRDSKPLYVTCQSPMGWHGHIALKSGFSLTTPIFGNGNSLIAETSDAADPQTPYQSNPSNLANGTLSSYPSSIIVPMTPDSTGTAY